MSKAEDLAKEYCEGSSFEDACMEKPAYIAGYHQAEKELELTVDDIKNIDRLLNQCVDYSNPYQEVLKRFRERKEK